MYLELWGGTQDTIAIVDLGPESGRMLYLGPLSLGFHAQHQSLLGFSALARGCRADLSMNYLQPVILGTSGVQVDPQYRIIVLSFSVGICQALFPKEGKDYSDAHLCKPCVTRLDATHAPIWEFPRIRGPNLDPKWQGLIMRGHKGPWGG